MKTRVIHQLFGTCALVLLLLTQRSTAQLPTPTPTPPNLPNPPYAVITYASANANTPSPSVVSRCVTGVFAMVGLQADQVIQIVVQYPTSQALQVVNLEALDGGTILPPSNVTPAAGGPLTIGQVLQGVPIPPIPQVLSLAIATDGTLTFTFIATHNPGRNQISLREAGQELGLEFWVNDAQNPQNNPPAITPGNPNPEY